MGQMEERFDWFERVELDLQDFPSQGWVLDIGGGGEGVIGRLKGSAVVAIDLFKQELEEAPAGPLKIVMDARSLQFVDGSFQTVTVFFAFLYMQQEKDWRQVLTEIARVLQPGGCLHVWDVDLSERPAGRKDSFALPLLLRIGEERVDTAYGARWPEVPRGEEQLVQMAQQAGLRLDYSLRKANTFYLRFVRMA